MVRANGAEVIFSDSSFSFPFWENNIKGSRRVPGECFIFAVYYTVVKSDELFRFLRCFDGWFNGEFKLFIAKETADSSHGRQIFTVILLLRI